MLAGARQLLEDWIEFERQGGADFDEWCRLRGRSYRWWTHYYDGEEPDESPPGSSPGTA